MRKQQQYSKDLMNEIEVRKQQREMEKEKGQLDLKRELEESNRVAENTAAQ